MTIRSKAEPKRLIHLDILRLLAIYLVVFNHTGYSGYSLYVNTMGSPLYFLYLAASIFCKIAVPVFFMISGALLLTRQESLKQLFQKRILRMVVVLIMISALYYFCFERSNGLCITDFLSFIYGNSATTSLWYLYSYIALLLLMPFLRSMVKNLRSVDYLYLFAGHVILVGVLPSLEVLLGKGNVTIHESFSPVLFITQNVFFALMGYYLEHISESRNNSGRKVWLGIAASVAAIGITVFVTYFRMTVIGVSEAAESEMFFNTFISIPAMTVYYLTKVLGDRIQVRANAKLQNCISTLGGAVFGVYLIEKFLRVLTSSIHTYFAPAVGSFFASLIWCGAVVSLGFIIILSLKHIPIVKNMVNKFI